MLKGIRAKGLGNKIDPSKGASDVTASLEDELLLRILSRSPLTPYPYSFVCKRWLKLHGFLRTSIKVREWSFLESGRMAIRFPNLTDVDLTGAWLAPPKHSTVLFTHQFMTIRLGPDAYDPFSIERFIEEQQLPPSSLDRGLKILADGCPGLQRLCVVDVRRATYNRSSFRRRDTFKLEDRAENQRIADSDAKQNEDFAKPQSLQTLKTTEALPAGGLSYVAKKCPMLQELVLNQCTDDSLYAISSCQNLQILRLVGTVSGFYHCTFTDIGLTILAKGCSRLVKLELSGCEASYDGIAAIGRCCLMLEELTLSNQGFYEGWIAALFYCSCLKTLRLESCKQIDPLPGPMEHIRHCVALDRLELVRCNLRDKAGFSALMSVSTNVRELYFQDCWGLDDDTFSLAEICRRVRLLSLEGCSLLTTAGLEALVLHWKDLHTLQVIYCNNIKDSEISPALALLFSTLKELKWRPDTKSLLADSLAGTGVGQVGGKFFKRGGPS